MSRESTRTRIEEFDFLTSCGLTAHDAALAAGWPTIQAAEIALRRVQHPYARALTAERARERRAHSEPKHVSEVMGEFLADLQHKAGGHRA